MNLRKGFTLLEMLLVIAIIAILAAIVIVAINPAKQIADANNAQRQSDVLAVLNAIHQYSIDNSGNLTALNIPSVSSATCGTNDDSLDLLDTDVDVLKLDAMYLSDIPTDPQAGTEDSGYHVVQDSGTGRITVCAPLTEIEPITTREDIISVTR